MIWRLIERTFEGKVPLEWRSTNLCCYTRQGTRKNWWATGQSASLTFCYWTLWDNHWKLMDKILKNLIHFRKGKSCGTNQRQMNTASGGDAYFHWKTILIQKWEVMGDQCVDPRMGNRHVKRAGSWPEGKPPARNERLLDDGSINREQYDVVNRINNLNVDEILSYGNMFICDAKISGKVKD